ncbi:molecular chaperone DnaK [Acetobacterium tundrae]|uniref:Chaperone protein DnaK n=1 Tax=Acetobacterium tundrae TaxID=132932 RepID=A0ABR6WKA9_9FIRM|nr:molecular chaperone DnaK [Acetobacterium tundrae]MBC3796953.1 molecular chaperone DnaK [Acetobacterium tundrae]
MSKLIGIDLGTTNSCVAVMEGSSPVIIPNENGGRTTPSIVAFTKQGERLVGEPAKRQMAINPERTISSIKREMGSDYHIKIDGKQYKPQEISAMILQKLKMDAEIFLGEPVTDAVITVPAYFTDSQRQATKDAGKIAGLNVQRIINEPTAAALAYGVNKENAQKIMVYDLGGGTFDVSILEINDGVIEVLATSGNNRLGGDDFDAVLTDYILKELKRETACNISHDASALARVREAGEQAKMELSGIVETRISLPFISQNKSGPVNFEMKISRSKFNELTAHLVKQTMEPVRQAMSDADLDIANINHVILVGGSTRIPAVQEAVRQYTQKEPLRGINPDEGVAIGASLQAGVLTGAVNGLLLLDITPLSLGIETVGGVYSKIINRNTTLPIRKSEVYSTARNFQTSVEIHVLQGERERAKFNKTLGKFKLSGIRRAARGVPQIEVSFELDANGIVNVSAKDLGTGKMQQITITASSNLSQSEIDQAIRDAKQYEAEDRQHKEEENAKNEVESLIYQAAELSKKLNKEDRRILKEEVKKAKKTLRSKDKAETSEAGHQLSDLMESLKKNVVDNGANSDDLDDDDDDTFNTDFKEK